MSNRQNEISKALEYDHAVITDDLVAWASGSAQIRFSFFILCYAFHGWRWAVWIFVYEFESFAYYRLFDDIGDTWFFVGGFTFFIGTFSLYLALKLYFMHVLPRQIADRLNPSRPSPIKRRRSETFE
ncbi:MAG: hypothetical protein AAF296_03020 [Pseudomonadota bacterium]